MGDASPTSLVRLFFTLENVAMPGLAIPKDDFKRYSFYPLKWLRFLGYAIYGFEGDLSETEDGDTVEYSSTDLKDSYYFVSKRGPSLVDVRSFPSATSSESDLNETFQKAVVERDINCIMTDIKANDDVRRDPCYASHIIPFIKTSDYITSLTRHRGGGDGNSNDTSTINDINDPRNGLVLYYVCRRNFRDGHAAFLKTPNFALNTTDIPSAPRIIAPSLNEDTISNHDGSRYTFHYFPMVHYDALLERFANHNSDAQISAGAGEARPTVAEGPSPLLLDFWYGCAAVQAWGTDEFKAKALDMTRDLYCPNGDEANRPRPVGTKDERLDRREDRYERRMDAERATRVDYFDLILGLGMHLRGAQESSSEKDGKDEKELKESVDKVTDWLADQSQAKDSESGGET